MTQATPTRLAVLRRRPVVFGLLLLAGLLAVVASAQPWWQAQAEGSNVAFSGTEATAGLSQALAVVVLVGVVLALTLGVRGRRVLAVLLAAAGVGVGVLGVLGTRPDADAVASRVRQVSLADQFDLSVTAWVGVYATAGVLMITAAALLAWSAGTWSQRAPRFERARAQASAAAADPAVLEDDPLLAWRAMDEGMDPTDPRAGAVSESGQDGAAPRDPDVREDSSRATMDDRPGAQPPR